VIQNRRADDDNLSAMRDTRMIRRFAENGFLVRVPAESNSYYLRSVPGSYRYLRPWAKLFLERISRQFHSRFRKKLRVTSLVRTVARQERLARRNGNAAAATGPRRSTHLTGATLDISYAKMTSVERRWIRRVLNSLKHAGHLYAVEEFQQPAFHVMVYRDYAEYVRLATARTGD
jgi:hypothetical protein